MKQTYLLIGFIAFLFVIGALVFAMQSPVKNMSEGTNIDGETVLIPDAEPVGLPGADQPRTGTPPLPTAGADGMVTVKIGGTIQLDDTVLSVVRVTQDSRCPVDVTCIWAGEVELEVLFIGKNGQQDKFYINSSAPNITIGNKDITLTTVLPPKQQEVIPANAYEFTFLVKPELKTEKSSKVGLPTGVKGKVLIGPACPVVRLGEECPDAPGAFLQLEIIDQNGAVASYATTDALGNTDLIKLTPGVYTIRYVKQGILPRIEDVQVLVSPNSVTEFTMIGDSGIR